MIHVMAGTSSTAAATTSARCLSCWPSVTFVPAVLWADAAAVPAVLGQGAAAVVCEPRACSACRTVQACKSAVSFGVQVYTMQAGESAETSADTLNSANVMTTGTVNAC